MFESIINSKNSFVNQYYGKQNIERTKQLQYNKIMSNKNYYLNGIADLLILFLLSESDKYVYEISKTITERSGGLLVLSQNTIYTATYKLENEGLISEYNKVVGKKRTRVYYHLEDKGKDYLDELKEIFEVTIKGLDNILKEKDSENVNSTNEK